MSTRALRKLQANELEEDNPESEDDSLSVASNKKSFNAFLLVSCNSKLVNLTINFLISVE